MHRRVKKTGTVPPAREFRGEALEGRGESSMGLTTTKLAGEGLSQL